MTLSTLQLTADQRDQMLDQATRGRPNEVCGVMGGWQAVARLIIPITNRALSPQNRYALDPVEFIAAYKRIEQTGGELIGIYHSHPSGEAVPSAVDIAEATWPDIAYVIVGFVAHSAAEAITPHMAAWSIRGGSAQRVPIQVIEEMGRRP